MPRSLSTSLSTLFLLILTALFSGLAGCANHSAVKYSSDEPFRVRPSLKPARFAPLWSKEAPPVHSFSSYNQEASGVAHVSADDSVIVARNNGKVTRYLAANGQKVWENRFPHSFNATPTAFEQSLYLPSLDGALLALNSGDGSTLWEAQVEHSLAGKPAANRDFVVALDAEDVLHCWDANTGKELWSFANERNNNFTIEGTSTPLIIGNSVIVGFAGGEVMRFNLSDGAKEWSLDLSGGKAEFADVDLIVPGPKGLFYAASRSGGIAEIEESSGRVIWRKDIVGVSAFDVTRDALYVGTTNNHVVALNPKTGEKIWQFTMKNTPTSIVHYGNYLVVATGEGSLYLLDGTTGYPFDKWNGFAGIHPPLTYAAERIYMHSDHGVVLTYKIGW